MPTTFPPYGVTVDSPLGRRRGTIARPSVSGTGNLVLEIGHELHPGEGTWEKSEHVVLTADEAAHFLGACQAVLAEHAARTGAPA